MTTVEIRLPNCTVTTSIDLLHEQLGDGVCWPEESYMYLAEETVGGTRMLTLVRTPEEKVCLLWQEPGEEPPGHVSVGAERVPGSVPVDVGDMLIRYPLRFFVSLGDARSAVDHFLRSEGRFGGLSWERLEFDGLECEEY